MIKTIKKNRLINKIVRSLVKKSALGVNNFFESVSNHWTVSGIVDLKFNNLDFKLYTNCDDGLADCFYYQKKYSEENDLRAFLEFAKQSKTVVDIGANTGLYSILAAKVNPQAEIYAFEPYHYNSLRLRKNCEINELKNVKIFEKAIGDVKSTIKFTVPKTERIIDVSSANEDFSKKFYGQAVEWINVDVEQISLDEFVEQKLPGKKIDLMKIDVESYEMAVFRGMKNILASHQPDILFESFIDDDRKEFFNEIIDKYKYTAYIFLRDGILRLDNGIQPNYEGLNFFLSKYRASNSYTSFREMNKFVSGFEKSLQER